MKAFLFLLLSVSASASAVEPRLLWWELPLAVKADKRPYFEALNRFRRNTGEGSLLADYATALVLCRVPAAFAERDCPVWRADIAGRTSGATITLAVFAASPPNRRFVVEAYAGMLTGAKDSLGPAERTAAEALLARAGTALASGSDADLAALAAQAKASGALWAAIAADASLSAFRDFAAEATAWLAAPPGATTLRFAEEALVIPSNDGLCRLEGLAISCEGKATVGLPPAFVDPQQLVKTRDGYCVLDGHEVKCWNTYPPDPLRGPGYLVAPDNLKNPYYLLGDAYDGTVCALDEEGLKCWDAKMSSPSVRPHADVMTAPERRYRKVVGVSSNLLCGLGDLGVRCWSAFNMGTNDRYDYYKDVTASLRNPRDLSFDLQNFCATTDDGLRCWPELWKAPLDSDAKVFQVASGGSHSCWIAGDSVRCAGNDVYGEASPPPGLLHPRAVVVGDATSCALVEDGWSCWGKFRKGRGLPPTTLLRPRLLAAGDEYTFALDAEGIKGWGKTLDLPPRYGLQDVRFLVSDGEYLYYATPTALYRDGKVLRELHNAHEIVISSPLICVVDDYGLHCTDSFGRPADSIWSPAAKHPHGLALTYDAGCFLDDDGVKCSRGGSSTIGVSQPQFTPDHPAALALLGGYGCLTEAAGAVRCWKWGETPFQPAFKVTNLRKLVSNRDEMCALDDVGVRCWNEKGLVPVPVALNHPFELALGGRHACAIDDEGVKCWGENWAGQATPLPTVKEN